MTAIINLLMVLVAVALIGYPFIAGNRRRSIVVEGDEGIVDRRQMLFSALGEIEFDYRMKKLGAEDYAELKETYQAQAMGVMEQDDAMLDKQLAEELARRRSVNRPEQEREDSDEQKN